MKRMSETELAARQVVLNIWLENNKIHNQEPCSKKFFPNTESPIMKMPIGWLDDGVQTFAYGVQTSSVVLEANPIANGPALCEQTVFGWEWHVDEVEARHEAHFRLWITSEEARDWFNEPTSPLTSPEEVTRVEQRLIAIIADEPLIAYRAVHIDRISGIWECKRRREDLLPTRHNALWKQFGVRQAEKALPRPVSNYQKISLPIDPVYDLVYGVCPETGEELHRYGAVCFWDERTRGFDVVIKWFGDRTRAEKVRTHLVENVECFQQEERDRIRRQGAEDEFYSAKNSLYDLYCGEQYCSLESYLNRDLIKRVHDYKHDGKGYVDEPKELLDTDELIDHTWMLVLFADELERALDTALQDRLAYLNQGGYKKKLALLLATHFPRCPVCRQKYRISDEWADRLLVYSIVHLSCGCPERGWDKNSKESIPAALTPQQIFSLGSFSHLAPTTKLDCTRISRAIVIEEVAVNNHTVLQMVLEQVNLCLRSAFVLDTQMLDHISLENPGELLETWSEAYGRCTQEQQKKADELVKTNKAIKLKLRNGDRGGLVGSQKTGGHVLFCLVESTYQGEARPEDHSGSRPFKERADSRTLLPQTIILNSNRIIEGDTIMI